jgi:hypothetical protein
MRGSDVCFTSLRTHLHSPRAFPAEKAHKHGLSPILVLEKPKRGVELATARHFVSLKETCPT